MPKNKKGGGKNGRRKNNGLIIAVIALAVLLVLLVACVVLMETGVIGSGTEPGTQVGTGQFVPVDPTEPTVKPSTAPSIGVIGDETEPTAAPTDGPTSEPTREPTTAPTVEPTTDPTSDPPSEPTTQPTSEPTIEPTTEPTSGPSSEPTTAPTTEPTTEPTTKPTEPPTQPTEPPTTPISPTEPDLTMDRGLEITDIGWYTGEYLEDGSNESVENILMVIVTNHGEDDIQYAEIQLLVNGEPAKFSITTLPAGESMILLELNRMPFVAGASYTNAEATNVAVFKTPMDTKSGQLKIQGLNGAVNVTNISGKDIEGDIVIYYKNVYGNTMYGGITYRITIQGGLKAGAVRQIMTKHFITDVSRVMFVTIDGQ